MSSRAGHSEMAILLQIVGDVLNGISVFLPRTPFSMSVSSM